MASPITTSDLDSLVVPWPVEGLDQEENIIGSGAFGVVYKVTVNGKVCAAKKFHKNLIQPAKFFARGRKDALVKKFHDECHTLSRLSHPNIVGFVGIHYGRDKSDMSLIMEYLYSDLAQHLARNPNSHISDKIHILYDVSKGLDYLHNGTPPLIHCDLTALNILLTRDLTAKIGDLGVSNYDELTSDYEFHTGAIVGALLGGIAFGPIGLGIFSFPTIGKPLPYYLPPEYRPPRSTVTTKLDIFSFGNLIIYTIIGEVPQVSHLYSDYNNEGKMELLKRDKAVHQMGDNHCLYPLVVRCLHDKPNQRPSAKEVKTLLKELCNNHPRQVTILQELMTDETAIKMQYTKLFFIGPPAVGKTLTRLRLCNEMKNMITRGDAKLPDSTPLANCNQVLMYINSKDGQNTWITSNDFKEEAQILFRYMCMLNLKKDKSLTGASASNSPKIESAGVTGTQSIEIPAASSTIGFKLPKIKGIFPRPQRIHPEPYIENSKANSKDDSIAEIDTQSIATKTDELISRLKDLTLDYSKFAELIEASMLVNIHDIGGQPGFLEMIPSLINGPAAYLVFFNLVLPLNEQYKIPFSRNNESITPFDSPYTVKSTISQILSAISSIDHQASKFADSTELPDYFKNDKPVATLVGTHLDQLEEEETMSIETRLEQKHKEIKEITENFSPIIVNPVNKSFFAIDNFTGTEESDLLQLRNHIMDVVTKKFNTSIPIRPAWLILNIILRKEFQVAPLSDCLEIGKQLNMDEEEAKKALWYLHHIVGAIIYKPEIKDEDDWFENNIICSPQVIFDNISEVIIRSLQMLRSDVPVRECFRRDWIQKGLFSLEAIKEVTASTGTVPIEKLLKLLEHFNLLSQIIVHDPPPYSPSIQLFMPAILECATFDELANPPTPDDNHPASVFLTFKFGYVPTGVFCGLITRIVTKGVLKIFGETWELKDDYVKRNKVTFHVSKVHLATIISHDTCYEIRIERRGSSISLNDLCSQVLITILYLLKEAYRHLEPIIAFQCPCDKHVTNTYLKHLQESSDVAICKEGGARHEIQLTDDQKVWIGKSAALQSEVEMRIVDSLPEGMTLHWSKNNTEIVSLSGSLRIPSVSSSQFGVYKVIMKQEDKMILSVYRQLFKNEIGPPLEILRRRFQISDSQLDTEIIERNLPLLAKCFDNYNYYLTMLGLTASEQADVRHVQFQERSHESAMREALSLWRKPNPGNATFRKLLDIVLSLGKRRVAQSICDYIVEHIAMHCF